MSKEINKEALLKWVGKRVVFRETGMLVPAVIKEIQLEPHFNVTMEPIDGIVLEYRKPPYPPHKTVSCGSAWPYLRVRDDEWSFAMSGCCWSIYLNEKGCDAAVALCKENVGMDPIELFRLADLAARKA